MRLKFVLATAMILALVPAAAFAGKGPGGSSEDKKGQLKCGKGTLALPVGTLYAGTNGIEICNADNTPPDGRIIITTGYIAVDGDPNNPAQGSGFLRIDSSGPSCGDAKHTDSTKKGVSCAPKAP
jgi:hypothetical protein